MKKTYIDKHGMELVAVEKNISKAVMTDAKKISILYRSMVSKAK